MHRPPIGRRVRPPAIPRTFAVCLAAAVQLSLLALWPAAGAAQPLPGEALSAQEKAQFLASAKIVASRDLPKGVTRPVRVTLTDGRITHDAAFSSIDERVPIMRFKGGRTELDFVDSYKYSIAAYRVAELLGLGDMMPVTVERQWDGRSGALSWWIHAKWDEAERIRQKKQPPDRLAWTRQLTRMNVFSQLVGDTDRNLGNVLITEDWRLWMIDFTRAFRRTRNLLNPAKLTRCDRELLGRLRELSAQSVRAAAHPYIGGAETDALLARRDRIIEHFLRLAAERGEHAVFLD